MVPGVSGFIPSVCLIINRGQIVIAIVGRVIAAYYLSAQLCVKRYSSVIHAPVLAHFDAAVSGLGGFSRSIGDEYFAKPGGISES
jgi:hypothetical protein